MFAMLIVNANNKNTTQLAPSDDVGLKYEIICKLKAEVEIKMLNIYDDGI